MANIEMISGRPQHPSGLSVNASGKLCLHLKTEEDNGSPSLDTFRLKASDWKHLLEVGQSLGWRPMGALLICSLDGQYPEVSDYRPTGWSDPEQKMFQAADAINLSKALYRSLYHSYDEDTDLPYASCTTWFNDSMAYAPSPTVSCRIRPALLLRFIEFLEKGAFRFGLAT